jgi:hypothetical protein
VPAIRNTHWFAADFTQPLRCAGMVLPALIMIELQHAYRLVAAQPGPI